jgi:hypothetical protein
MLFSRFPNFLFQFVSKNKRKKREFSSSQSMCVWYNHMGILEKTGIQAMQIA